MPDARIDSYLLGRETAAAGFRLETLAPTVTGIVAEDHTWVRSHTTGMIAEWTGLSRGLEVVLVLDGTAKRAEDRCLLLALGHGAHAGERAVRGAEALQRSIHDWIGFADFSPIGADDPVIIALRQRIERATTWEAVSPPTRVPLTANPLGASSKVMLQTPNSARRGEGWRNMVEALARKEATQIVIEEQAARFASSLVPLLTGRLQATVITRLRTHVDATEALGQARSMLAELDKGATGLGQAAQRLTARAAEVATERIVELARPCAAVRAYVLAEDDAPAAVLDNAASEVTGCLHPARRRITGAQLLEPMYAPPARAIVGAERAAGLFRLPTPAGRLAGFPTRLGQGGRPPARVAGEPEGPRLGVDTTKAPVHLDASHRLRHVHVIGPTGTGKSTLLCTAALDDAARGEGFTVIDPHGSLVDDILARMPAHRRKDVVVIDPTDPACPGFNPLALPALHGLSIAERRDLVVSEMIGYCLRTFPKEMTGPIFESQARCFLALLIGDGQKPVHLADFLRIYTDRTFRRGLVDDAKSADPVLAQYADAAESGWGDTSIAGMSQYVASKFNRFFFDTNLSRITGADRMVDFTEVINRQQIVLVRLRKGRFGREAAALLAGQVVARLAWMATARGPEVGPPHYVYVDEVQLVADDQLADLFAEARKYRLGFTVAHQFLEQLPDNVREALVANVGTTVCFRPAGPDAIRLAPLLQPEFRASALATLPDYTAAVRSGGTLGARPFALHTEPLPGPRTPEDAIPLDDDAGSVLVRRPPGERARSMAAARPRN